MSKHIAAPPAAATLAILLPFAGPAAGQVSGRAVPIDGDTIQVAGERVRLHGIDAPEQGGILAGHGRLLAARKLGLAQSEGVQPPIPNSDGLDPAVATNLPRASIRTCLTGS